MKRILPLLPLICLVIPGCLLLSLQPYYEEDDIVDHRAFAGKWESDNGKTVWEFTPKKAGYQLAFNESGKLGEFEVTPFRIGGELFLNFYPDMTGDSVRVLTGLNNGLDQNCAHSFGAEA